MVRLVAIAADGRVFETLDPGRQTDALRLDPGGAGPALELLIAGEPPAKEGEKGEKVRPADADHPRSEPESCLPVPALKTGFARLISTRRTAGRARDQVACRSGETGSCHYPRSEISISSYRSFSYQPRPAASNRDVFCHSTHSFYGLVTLNRRN
jgi:hypothetical protein